MGKLTVVSQVQLAPLFVTAAHPPPMTLPVSSQLSVRQQLHEPRQLSPMGVPKLQVHPASPSCGQPAPQIKPVSVHISSETPGDLGGGGGTCGDVVGGDGGGDGGGRW